MAIKRWSESDWAREAGLKERSNVNKLIRRMTKHPERIAGDINTFALLATAAGVSLDWLALGVGLPVANPVAFGADEHYPTRGQVLVGAFLMGFSMEIIDAVRAHNEPAIDPGWEYWRRMLELKAAEFAALGAKRSPQLGE